MTTKNNNPNVLKNFPSNSKMTKTEKKDDTRESVDKGQVITKSAKRRKKGRITKFFSSFLGEDIDNVGSYVFKEVMMPAVIDTIPGLITGVIEMAFYGEVSARSRGRKRNSGTGSYVSYNKGSSRSPRKKSIRSKLAHDFDDITFDDKYEAQQVLDYLVDLTIDHDMASVADLYRAIGMKAEYTDEEYGWYRLSTARVRKIADRHGGYYIISFPVTEDLV